MLFAQVLKLREEVLQHCECGDHRIANYLHSEADRIAKEEVSQLENGKSGGGFGGGSAGLPVGRVRRSFGAAETIGGKEDLRRKFGPDMDL